MKTVAVIGGGIAGLSAAEAIERRARERGRPVRVIVLEADAVAGGKVGTEDHGDFVVERGPHGFLDKEPAVTALIERLGLTPRLLRADEASARRYVVRAGRLRELPDKPPRFLTSDVLPLLGRLRVLMEPLVRQRPADAAEESVWSFAARRIGRSAADVLIDALVTGIYGGDPKKLSVAACFPALTALERKHGSLIRGQLAQARAQRALGSGGGGGMGPRGVLHSFDRGLRVLIEALVGRLEVRTGAAVVGLERAEAGASSDPASPPRPRWRLALARGEPLVVDAVAATTPADVLASLLAPHGDAAPLTAIPYAPVAVVVHAFEASALRGGLGGFGFLAPEGEGRQVLGTIWASTVFRGHAPPGTVMLRSMVGGARHPERLAGDDAQVAAGVRRELEALLGLEAGARPRLEHVLRWPRAIPQYTLGHASRVAAADALEARLPGVVLGGNALRGVALVQCVADAERVAGKVLDHLGSEDS